MTNMAWRVAAANGNGWRKQQQKWRRNVEGKWRQRHDNKRKTVIRQGGIENINET